VSRLDWVVLVVTLFLIVAYGVWKGRRHQHLAGYLLADRQLRWPTIALSIMATQASAITFLSTPGQAFADGMRFVQFYLGLPVAMVILAITAVPIYHRLRVFTAYEYLESRFDVRTRTLTALLFLVQRGLSTGITLYAPALIISVLLGWNLHVTNVVIGLMVIVYTATGGTKAVSWTHVHQLLIALGGMAVALIVAIRALPHDVGLLEAARVAGRMGRLNAIDFSFDLSTPYNFWSGLIGGGLVALSYFGTDQSQVQRYLTGASESESKLGLLMNGMIKVPMQFFILFVGAMVFVFYQFVAPPLFFNNVERAKIGASRYAGEYAQLEARHQRTFEAKRAEVHQLVDAMRAHDASAVAGATERIHALQKEESVTRTAAADLIRKNDRTAETSDTNYVFLGFVVQTLPAGLIGLVLAAIFCAAMSATSSGLNSLASTTVVDVVKRLLWRNATDDQYVLASKLLTVFWGFFAIGFAEFASRLGSLIEAVNILGSLFYGTILAIFLLAFYTKRISGPAVCLGAIVSEAAVLWCKLFTNVAWLWWNVVGLVVGVLAAFVFERLRGYEVATPHRSSTSSTR
jgi:SSS family solute:Na+ symporter